ncbi:phage integrase N-terminal domain-containing protein [Aquabacterium humicola]|uniref:phage integrase N-terminal domain-containing protein n=1 Tax=Aquabacterium humicola TaxID=3237377 RepID=UPI002543864E|nr:phage integrase N-terminal domain-containing protein [Rubrivivax pictus]
MRVLEVLLELFNARHTALEKTVSHKTRQERANFLRRFFRDLGRKAGFPSLPDPRNLGQKHVQAMVQVWQREQLAPATIQTYLSFLRGLASWMGKPGFIRKPEHYGLVPSEFQRHENAQRDKSWAAHGVDVDAALAQVESFDARIAASMRLMDALALRRKESVTFRPFQDVVPFAFTGLSEGSGRADVYVRIKGKGGRVRWLPVQTQEQRDAVAKARALAGSRDAHMGDPAHSLKSNLRRLDYAMRKFGFTGGGRGVTMHGLRHGRLQAIYEEIAGEPAPVCGGGSADPAQDRAARLVVSRTAGHARLRAAAAYLGGPGPRRTGQHPAGFEPGDGTSAKTG